jgi:hypothetical protein
VGERVNSRLFVLVLTAVLIIHTARAEESPPITVEGSNFLRYDSGSEVDTRRADFNYPDNTIKRPFFEDRLQLDLYRGNLRLGGRFLYFRPSNEDKYRDALLEQNKIDKRYLEATFSPFRLRVGNFSDVWGYGLAFSSFENRDIYFDSELDGVHVQFESEPFFFTVLRGNSEDGRLVKHAEVTAARGNLRTLGQSLGFNYVSIDSGAYPKTHISSVDWRFSRGLFTLYGERAWNEAYLSLNPVEGHATYVGSVLSKWGWSVLLEYKDYDYVVATPFQNPAIVYRELGPRLLQGREPHVLNIPNEVGYQGELSGMLTSTTFTTLHYNLSSRHPKDEGAIPLPTLQQADAPYWEMFASAEQDLPANRRLTVELGSNEEAAVLWQKRLWASLRLQTPVGGTHEVDIESETVLITDRLRNDQKFNDQLVAFGWTDGGPISLTVGSEFSTDKALKLREGNNWPFAELAMAMGGGRNRLSIFYGRERGGLRCSNGVCRQVQAFSGVRVTMETSL